MIKLTVLDKKEKFGIINRKKLKKIIICKSSLKEKIKNKHLLIHLTKENKMKAQDPYLEFIMNIIKFKRKIKNKNNYNINLMNK
jgi:hypothetical protein